MGKWAVIYSSVTGNTEKIARRMAEAAGEAELFPLKDAPEDLSAYEVVALGYWLRLGGPDPGMRSYLPRIRRGRVLLFQTHGTQVGSEHSVTAFARAACLLGEDCEILGTFACRGKIHPALIEKRKQAGPEDPHGGPAALERWKSAATHPDEQDLQDAADFVAKMKRKLMLRQKFQEKKTQKPLPKG